MIMNMSPKKYSRTLANIHKNRIEKFHRLKEEKKILSMRKLCDATHMHTASLSKMIAKGEITEFYARTIEEYLNLPMLWMDLDDTLIQWDVPGYFFDQFDSYDQSPSFHLKALAEKNYFYLKFGENANMTVKNRYVLFKPINAITEIHPEDLCLLTYKGEKHLMRFDGKLFSFETECKKSFLSEKPTYDDVDGTFTYLPHKSEDSMIEMKSVKLIAKCVKIDFAN